MSSHNQILEIIKVSPIWKDALKNFLGELETSGDTVYFSPHPNDDSALDFVTTNANKDLYYLLVEGKEILGYGLLRGWNEGFAIPSLGIAISPKNRGQGLAKLLMQFLYIAAYKKGAERIRLRVMKHNTRAIKLYEDLGYSFEDDQNNNQFLVGYKTIA